MLLRLFLLAVVCLLLPDPCPCQDFGENQVRLRDFGWKVVSTEHFDIHYYAESEPLVPFAAEVLERRYSAISRALGVGFDRRRPFFLYASANDMQQSTIVEVGDGTGGVTEALKDRFMVFNDGSRKWLETVITHELVHVFQYRILLEGFWRSGRILKTFIYPLWMMEGIAEQQTGLSDYALEKLYVRDAVLSGTLIPLSRLNHFSHLKPHQVRLAYELGGEAMDFLEKEFGPGTVERLIKKWESSFESGGVLHELVGLDSFGLDRKWREYLEQKYARAVRVGRLREPGDYGEALTRPAAADIPEFNTTPAFSPDGRRVAFLSTKDGYPPGVYLKDLSTGKERRLLSHDTRVESLSMGNFADISRTLAFSPDGRRLAFPGTKNHRDAIYLYDLERGRLERIPVEGLSMVNMPAFSPDGKLLAFSGMKGAFTDIYVMDLAGRSYRALTSDPQDDQSPSFSPDGGSIVYSSEVQGAGGGGEPYQRRLYSVSLEDGRAERLADPEGCARDPVHSPDGRRILFSLERGGSQDIYELDLGTRGIRRLTRSIGAAYTPVYVPAVSTSAAAGGATAPADIAFSGFRKGSIHVYRGPREKFLEEETDQPQEQRLPQAQSSPRLSSPVDMSAHRPVVSPFSTDIFLPAFFFSTNGGLFWTSYWMGSDLLGRHGVQSFLSYASGAGMLDYETAYSYSRWRPRLVAGFRGRWRKQQFDEVSGYTLRQFSHMEFGGVSYPLDRFHRVESFLSTVSDEDDYVDADELVRRDARMASASFVRDTVRGRYLVATSGDRLRLSYLASPRVLGGNYSYQSVFGEAHRYVPTGGQSALALRALGTRSWGPDLPAYAVGGVGGVRGYARQDDGSSMMLGSAEWRIPLLSNLDYYMWYIFPDFYFKAVYLRLFTDAGFAWTERAELSGARWRQARHSYGLGLNLHTFIMQLFPVVVQFDYAQRTTTNDHIFYVYLGPLF